MTKDNFLHCWADETSQYEMGSDEWAESYVNMGVCMLEAGHDGPHVFTPGDEVIICFINDEAVIAEQGVL